MIDKQATTAVSNAPVTYEPNEKLRPASDLVDYAQRYAREKPAVVALVCVGVGFVLGWKLKPW